MNNKTAIELLESNRIRAKKGRKEFAPYVENSINKLWDAAFELDDLFKKMKDQPSVANDVPRLNKMIGKVIEEIEFFDKNSILFKETR